MFTSIHFSPFFPQAGVLGRDLFLNNFTDQDPSSGLFRDWDCSNYSYDGHHGHDSLIRSFREQAIGVPVFAVLPGVVVSTHDGEPDENTVWSAENLANFVSIDHGGGYTGLYFHLRRGSVAVTPGQTVAIIPYLSCLRCVACRRGKTNCCQSIRVLGVHIDGGLCDLLAVPERNVVPVGDLSVDQAAMIEFLAISAHGVRRAAPGSGDRVLVVGAGPIGMAAVIFAKSRGAHVTALDRDLPYEEWRSLSFESRQKLAQIRPATLAQAARIPGVSPTDLQNLVLEIEKRRRRGVASSAL